MPQYVGTSFFTIKRRRRRKKSYQRKKEKKKVQIDSHGKFVRLTFSVISMSKRVVMVVSIGIF